MDDTMAFPWYDQVSNSEAMCEQKEVVSDEIAPYGAEETVFDYMDEDLNDETFNTDFDYAGIDKVLSDAVDRIFKPVLDDEVLDDPVDKICKGILDYISPTCSVDYLYAMTPYIINKTRIDLQATCSSGSGFLAFSKKYNSKFKEFMERYSRVGIYPIQDMLWKHDPKTSSIAIPNDEDYKNFKRFDTVKDYSDHLFRDKPMEKRSKSSAERIQQELRILEGGLPETMFVRVYESRMDLLRAVVIGPKGTPYHDGLFFFDVYFPLTYPMEPPLLRYHSCGFAINPHLFECGEVRLNLIRTWTSSIHRIWNCHITTVLEVLVSIQDQVLNADPLFHQPGFVDSGPSVDAEYFSLLYNENILIKLLQIMLCIIKKPPKNFEAFVAGHFRSRALDILTACEAYMNGLRVGCVVGNNESCCSVEFQKDVASCIMRLVYDFKAIGATVADNFIHLTLLAPKLVLGSASMYHSEPSRRSSSTSAALFDENAFNDVDKRLNMMKLSEILHTPPVPEDASMQVL